MVDWPEASIGAPWLDLVLALPSIGMFEGTPPLHDIAETSALLGGVEPHHLTTVIAAMAGFFLCASVEPDWLRHRVGGSASSG